MKNNLPYLIAMLQMIKIELQDEFVAIVPLKAQPLHTLAQKADFQYKEPDSN